jgi:hypothetical protein
VTRSRLQKTAAHESTALSPITGLYYRGYVLSLPAAERRQLCCRTPELREQSENVYENKESRSRGVEQSRSFEAEPGSQTAECRRFVTLQPSTLDFSTRILTNDPEMSMKTKEGHGKLRCGTIALRQGCLISRSPDRQISRSRDHRISDRAGHNGPLARIASVSNATLSSSAPGPPTVCAAAARIVKPRRLRNVA